MAGNGAPGATAWIIIWYPPSRETGAEKTPRVTTAAEPMGDEEEEEYDFEYSDDDNNDEDEADVDLENSYFSAKALKAEDPKAAVEAFREIMSKEGEPGIWGFKALKQMMKLLFSMSAFQEFSECYTQLLGYTKGAVTQNVGEKGVNSVLDYVSSSNDWNLLKRCYEQTLDTLREHKNDRLWFKCNLKLGHLMYDVDDMGRLQRIIKELLRACKTEGDGEDDGTNAVKRGTQLLEIFALQILMHSRQRDKKKLREVYERAQRIQSAIPHPRVMATILECGGKMHMQEREWDQACTAFFHSFKNYDEAGDPERLQVLKYLVMASILHESKIDPFDSQEAKPYKQDPEIVAMTNLVTAFRNKQIKDFERILKTHHASLMGDPFIKLYMDDILRTMRTQVLLKAIAPYTRVRLPYLASELNGIPVADVEDLLVSLILDGKVDGKIDQVNEVVVCGKMSLTRGGEGTGDTGVGVGSGAGGGAGSGSGSSARTALALGRWAEALRTLNAKIVAKVDYR